MLSLIRYESSLKESVERLGVSQEQTQFVGDISAILNSLSESSTGYVIVLDEIAVGFFIIDLDYAKSYQFATPGSVGLRSFFIDREFQGRGLAKAALLLLPRHIKSLHAPATSVFLTVNCRNESAIRLYGQCGFIDTHQLYLGGSNGPQHVMEKTWSDGRTAG